MRTAELKLKSNDGKDVFLVCPTTVNLFTDKERVYIIDVAGRYWELFMTKIEARSELDHALREIR